MGTQVFLLSAVIASIVWPNKRSTAFGVFDTGFGFAWFGSSVLMGILYGKSIPALIGYSVAIQLLSLPIFLLLNKKTGNDQR